MPFPSSLANTKQKQIDDERNVTAEAKQALSKLDLWRSHGFAVFR